MTVILSLTVRWSLQLSWTTIFRQTTNHANDTSLYQTLSMQCGVGPFDMNTLLTALGSSWYISISSFAKEWWPLAQARCREVLAHWSCNQSTEGYTQCNQIMDPIAIVMCIYLLKSIPWSCNKWIVAITGNVCFYRYHGESLCHSKLLPEDTGAANTSSKTDSLLNHLRFKCSQSVASDELIRPVGTWVLCTCALSFVVSLSESSWW